MTLDEWVEWLDWCRRELVSAEALESQIHDAAATPVGQPFVLF